MANRQYEVTMNNNNKEAGLTLYFSNEQNGRVSYYNRLGREENKSIKVMNNWSMATVGLPCIEDKSVTPTAVLSLDNTDNTANIYNTEDVTGTNPAIKLGIKVTGGVSGQNYENVDTIKLTITNGDDTTEYSGAKEFITELDIAGAETSVYSGDKGDIKWNGAKLSTLGSSIGTFEYTDSTGTHTGDIDSKTVMKSLVDKAVEIYGDNGGTVKINLSATTTPVLKDAYGVNILPCKNYKQVYSGVGVDGDQALYAGMKAYQVTDNLQDIDVANKVIPNTDGDITLIDFTSAVSATTKYLAIMNYNGSETLTIKKNADTVVAEVVAIFEITYTP